MVFFNITVSTINQWALDFEGNFDRIIRSCKLARQEEADYVILPELAISGYGCQDHFLETETIDSAMAQLQWIVSYSSRNTLSKIIIDVGCPIEFKGVLYNCRVIILNGIILLIRPKLILANDGVHRESRWFTPWCDEYHVVDYKLSSGFSKIREQETAPFGNAMLSFENVVIGFETCEEMWSPDPLHFRLFKNGADIVLNASASHHELRKLDSRIDLINTASKYAGGGAYVYSNLRGCDAERICYDGGSLVSVGGKVIARSSQFSLKDVENLNVSINLDDVREKRISNKSYGLNASADKHSKFKLINVRFELYENRLYDEMTIAPLLTPEEEIAYMPALWLWDILRRTESGGFFLCLSGGIDSCSVALIVRNMCEKVFEAIQNEDLRVAEQYQQISGKEEPPTSASEICKAVLTTCYMPTENNSVSSAEIAKKIAEGIGAQHFEVPVDSLYKSFVSQACDSMGMSQKPRFKAEGGSNAESLVLQNVQARCRMVMGYLVAQLLPLHMEKEGVDVSTKLVLGSGNLDETLVGYLTKYDCSSADLNPIGSISKRDIRSFVQHELNKVTENESVDVLKEALTAVLAAAPSAELEMRDGAGDSAVAQTDEEDMKLTYDELSVFGRLRKQQFCGPMAMLNRIFDGKFPGEEILTANGAPVRGDSEFEYYYREKVKLFYIRYCKNRHKATVLPPAYHAESYNADDNRFDLRPFVYPLDIKELSKALNLIQCRR